jgi:hypothetical protein
LRPSTAAKDILKSPVSKVAVTPVSVVLALIAAAILAACSTSEPDASIAPISTPLIKISPKTVAFVWSAAAAPVVVVALIDAVTPVTLLMALMAFALEMPLAVALAVETPSFMLLPTWMPLIVKSPTASSNVKSTTAVPSCFVK